MPKAPSSDPSPHSDRLSVSDKPPALPGGSDFNELAALLTQFYAACCSSGMRYWSSLAQLYGANAETFGKDIMELYKPDLSADERCRKVENLRTCLRQSSELLDRESRALQAQFAELDHKLSQLGNADPSTENKRFARIKS